MRQEATPNAYCTSFAPKGTRFAGRNAEIALALILLIQQKMQSMATHRL
jgi:hypothetical protein